MDAMSVYHTTIRICNVSGDGSMKKDGFISVRIDPELLAEVRAIAASRDRSISSQIVRWVRFAVKKTKVRNRGIPWKTVASAQQTATPSKERIA